MVARQFVPVKSQVVSLPELLVFSKTGYELSAFDDRTIDFFDALSKNILSCKSINHLPEMAALGFWLRKANLSTLKKENSHLFSSSHFRVSPLGKVFHVCPANVDTMFIYSLAVSVLMGNKNLLRISSRMDAPQVNELFRLLNETMLREEFRLFIHYINIISYDHNSEISSYISENCNARIIWGGDATINTFKDIKTAPRTKDIVFADRVSMLCIGCHEYLKLEGTALETVLRNFYNDAYTFDQMGCSSPQTIYFVGERSTFEQCLEKFHSDCSAYLEKHYQSDLSSLASLKLNRMVDDTLEGIFSKQTGNGYAKFLELEAGVNEVTLHGCGGGYFYVRSIESTSELKHLQHPKVQTISYFGLQSEDIGHLAGLSNGEGIDRIVPMGKALQFHYIWDGYNLFDELSKKVFIQ